MRFWTALVIVCLLAPSALAHGEYHGSSFPRQFEVPTAVRATNNTVVTILYESSPGVAEPFAAGDLFVLSGEARGPGSIRVGLQRTLSEDRSELVATWTFAPVGTETKGVLLPGDGEYSLVIETAHTEWSPFTFYFDHSDLLGRECSCGQRWLSPTPQGNTGVFTVVAGADGPLAVELQEPAAHHLEIRALEALRPGAQLEHGFRVLDTSRNDDGPVTTHKLQWDAQAGQRYYVLATSLDDDAFNSRQAPGNVDSPWHAKFELATPSNGAPSPVVWLVGLAMLALARTRR